MELAAKREWIEYEYRIEMTARYISDLIREDWEICRIDMHSNPINSSGVAFIVVFRREAKPLTTRSKTYI